MIPSEKLGKLQNQSNYLKCSTTSFHSSSSSSCNNRFSARRCCFCFAAAWSFSQRGSFACRPSVRRPFWASKIHRERKVKSDHFLTGVICTVLPKNPNFMVFFLSGNYLLICHTFALITPKMGSSMIPVEAAIAKLFIIALYHPTAGFSCWKYIIYSGFFPLI